VIRDAARVIGLRPREGADVAAALTSWDRDWLLGQLGAVVSASPEAIDAILYNVRFADDAEPDAWLDVVRRLARLGFSQEAILQLAPLTIQIEPARSAIARFR